MPGIADSLRQAGYLQPGVQGFQTFLQNMTKQKEQNAFNNLLTQAHDQILNNFQKVGSIPNGISPTRLSDLQPKPNVGIGGVQNVPQSPGQPQSLGQISPQPQGNHYAEMSPLEQKQKNLRVLADIMTKSSAFQNLPPEQKQAAIMGLQTLVQGSETPMPQYQNVAVPETSSLYRFNQTNPNEAPQLIQKGMLKSPTKSETVMDSKGQPVITEKSGHKFITVKHTYGDGTSTTELKPLPKDASSVASNIAADRLGWEKKKYADQHDPNIIMKAAQDNIAAIDEQLKDPNLKVSNPGAYNSLMQDRVKEVTKYNVAKRQAESQNSKQPNKSSKKNDPLGIR
ncbi:MAG: hypothetical protein ACYDBV_11160 [Nitrospiria bacterium]